MRKLFTLIFAIALIFTFTGMALADPEYTSGTDGFAQAGAIGDTYTKARVFGYPGYADESYSVTSPYTVESSQFARSGAWAIGDPATADIDGMAFQYTTLDISGSDPYVEGGQNSQVGFYANAEGPDLTLNGWAQTTGSTIGEITEGTGWQNTSTAYGSVGSEGEAYAAQWNSCADDRFSYAIGGGVINSGTYTTGSGEAWTNGSASYSYNSEGEQVATGSGFAETYGTSAVSYSSASATHTSYSSTGGDTFSQSYAGIGSVPQP